MKSQAANEILNLLRKTLGTNESILKTCQPFIPILKTCHLYLLPLHKYFRVKIEVSGVSISPALYVDWEKDRLIDWLNQLTIHPILYVSVKLPSNGPEPRDQGIRGQYLCSSVYRSRERLIDWLRDWVTESWMNKDDIDFVSQSS